jgi:hypothetical protein
MALDHIEGGPVIALENGVPAGVAIRPNGHPAWIVEERVGKYSRSRVVTRCLEPADVDWARHPSP